MNYHKWSAWALILIPILVWIAVLIIVGGGQTIGVPHPPEVTP